MYKYRGAQSGCVRTHHASLLCKNAMQTKAKPLIPLMTGASCDADKKEMTKKRRLMKKNMLHQLKKKQCWKQGTSDCSCNSPNCVCNTVWFSQLSMVDLHLVDVAEGSIAFLKCIMRAPDVDALLNKTDRVDCIYQPASSLFVRHLVSHP